MTVLRAELQPHPASDRSGIRRFTVELDVAPKSRALLLDYSIEGDIDRLVLPPPGIARRVDGLWQHSCFEAFLGTDRDESYHEFNFAPSGDWAAWRFGGRRSAQSSPELPAPSIEFRRDADACRLSATVSIGSLPELADAADIRAGMAAVVETQDGALSYWALAHGGERPDFHDPASFLLRVGPR
jgi:hypothetical protein